MEAPIAEIKPSIKKAFISNIVIVLVIVTLIIGFMVYLNTIVGLDVFLVTFRDIGFNISPASLVGWFIFLVLFFTSLLLFLNYVALAKVSYTLYPDKIAYSKSFFIMQVSDKVVPYSNISKISFEKKPFLNTAKITFEITGMKEKKMEMDFMDDAGEVVQKIQALVNDYRARYYARYTQDYRMQNLMDRL